MVLDVHLQNSRLRFRVLLEFVGVEPQLVRENAPGYRVFVLGAFVLAVAEELA